MWNSDVWREVASIGAEWYQVAWRGIVWHDVKQLGAEWLWLAWHGVWRDVLRFGAERHRVVRPLRRSKRFLFHYFSFRLSGH